jgi:aspartokinase-like uncharacterized kinase
MAIAAMEQYGWFIPSFGILATDKISVPLTTTVLLPYRYLILTNVLPLTWDVTSDTIAVWVDGVFISIFSFSNLLMAFSSTDSSRSSNRAGGIRFG